MKARNPPFVIGVLADLRGQAAEPRPRPRDRRFITVTKESLARLPRNAGLSYLVESLAGIPNVAVMVWDISQRELLKDLRRAPEVEQTLLFRKVYSEAAGTFGGEAFGCLVGDYCLTDSSGDVELVEEISHVAAAARAPFLCGLEPGFLPVKRKCFCESKAAGMVFLLLPRFAVAGRPEAEEPFDRGWINAAFLAASVAGRQYRETGLLEVAQSLFPGGSGRAPEASGGVLASEVEFESDFSEDHSGTLRELGVNALTRASVAGDDLLRSLTSVARGSGGLTLAAALAWSNLLNRLHERERYELL